MYACYNNPAFMLTIAKNVMPTLPFPQLDCGVLLNLIESQCLL